MVAVAFETELAVGFADSLNNTLAKIEILSAKDVHTTILVCNFLQTLFKTARRSIESALCQGVEARAFAAKYERSLVGLDAIGKTVDRVLERVRASRLPTLGDECIFAYEDLAADLAKLRLFLQEAIQKAKMPHRPIDWERVREAEEAYNRGEMKPLQKTSEIRGGG